jgi:hypothetical protein
MKRFLHKNGCVISETTSLQAGHPRNLGRFPQGQKSYLFSEASRRDLRATKHGCKLPKVKLALHPIYCRRQVRLELFLHSPCAFKACSGAVSPVHSTVEFVAVNGIDLAYDGDEWRAVTTFWVPWNAGIFVGAEQQLASQAGLCSVVLVGSRYQPLI